MDFWDKESFTGNLLEELLVLIKGIRSQGLKINLQLGDKYKDYFDYIIVDEAVILGLN